MEKNTIIKLQIVMICIAVVLVELAIFLLFNNWITLLIMVAINLIAVSLGMELLPEKKN